MLTQTETDMTGYGVVLFQRCDLKPMGNRTPVARSKDKTRIPICHFIEN